MKKINKVNVVIILITFLLTFPLGFVSHYFVGGSGTGPYDARFSDFFRVFDAIVDNHYFFDGDDEALIMGATEGLVAAVGDPHSRFFSLTDFENTMSHLQGSFYGIGAEVTSINGEHVIVSPFPDSPAENYGVLPGDIVREVDGEDVTVLTLNETIALIRGEEGTVVTLGLARDGMSQLVYIEVTRGEIAQQSVLSEIYEKDGARIGYIQVTVFGETTHSEFEDAIAELEEEGIDSLIVDLRNNSGGYLNAVVSMMDYLLPPDLLITTAESREGTEEEFRTTNRSPGKDYPMLTLINGGSASASEIFAAAMIESGGFDVLGTTSFGKGTVQQSRGIGNDGMLQMTTQVWLTPDGNLINEHGITPTIYVEAPEFFSYAQVFLGDLDYLEHDMIHIAIQNAQQILDVLGYDVARTDGYFDQSTKRAVRAFQSDNDLDATGIIDGPTARAITMALRNRIRDSDYDTQLQAAIEFLK